VGCKGGAEIAVQIWVERSSPRVGPGTNSWKSRQLGGVSQTLSRHSLFLAGGARSVLVDYREEKGLAFDRRAINYVVLRGRHVLDAHENLARRSDAKPLFRDR